MTARQAVQTAEDARAIAVKRQGDDLLAIERQAGVDREARAESGRAAAESETDRVKRQAMEAQANAENEAARVKRSTDAQTAAALVEAGRLKSDNDARTAAAETEADGLLPTRLFRSGSAHRATGTARNPTAPSPPFSVHRMRLPCTLPPASDN